MWAGNRIAVQQLNGRRQLVVNVGGEQDSCSTVERETVAGGECCSRRDGGEAASREAEAGSGRRAGWLFNC